MVLLATAARAAYNTTLCKGNTAIAEVTRIEGVDVSVTSVDVTSMDSVSAFGEFIMTVIAPGSVSFDLNYIPNSTTPKCRSASPIGTMPNWVASRVSAVTQGLVARMCSHHQLLFISLTLSIRMKPGSAKS